MQAVPTLRMLSEDAAVVRTRAERLSEQVSKTVADRFARVDVVPETGRAGGGALPMCDIDTFAVRVSFLQGSAQECEEYLVKRAPVPVVGRIKKECVLLDARTLSEEDLPAIAESLGAYFNNLDARKETCS
jgi:L-seryl-tRNA(Ser) seleniumtransferase